MRPSPGSPDQVQSLVSAPPAFASSYSVLLPFPPFSSLLLHSSSSLLFCQKLSPLAIHFPAPSDLLPLAAWTSVGSTASQFLAVSLQPPPPTLSFPSLLRHLHPVEHLPQHPKPAVEGPGESCRMLHTSSNACASFLAHSLFCSPVLSHLLSLLYCIPPLVKVLPTLLSTTLNLPFCPPSLRPFLPPPF